MSSYAIRFDTHNSDLVQYLVSVSGSYAYVFEGIGSDNPHTHMLCCTSAHPQTLRKHITDIVGKGNKAYSLKVCKDEIKYLAYMQKEGTMVHKGIPPQTIQESLDYKEKVQTEMKDKKKVNRTVIQKLLDEYGDRPREEKHILRFVLRYYKDNAKIINKFQIVNIVQTMCIKLVVGYSDIFEKDLYGIINIRARRDF